MKSYEVNKNGIKDCVQNCRYQHSYRLKHGIAKAPQNGGEVKVEDVYKRQHMSQTELAEKIGLDVRTIINIENYRGNPKLEVLYPLVRELKILPEEIFFPENKVSSEIRDRVMLEISDCNKTELKALIPVIQSFKEAIRTRDEEAE